MTVGVLIADDEEAIRRLMGMTLGGDPRYRLMFASNGAEALEMARRQKPALMFLDVHMPRMSGVEVCRALKSDPASRITIVMVTALGTDSDRQQAMEAGADDYLVKPFSPTELLQKREEVLSRLPSKEGALAVGGLSPREQEAPSFEQMGREQLLVYAQELRHLFLEEQRLRGDLEQKVREIQGLNQMVQAHLAQERQVLSDYREVFRESKRLMKEIQALAARAESLPLPESLDDAGASSRDDNR